ncbi:MAG: 6-bladed beta-propeller [Lentisphaeraceae bacterium]|nr:6-bladed beta-propeller [Lentisphaeraceae bacterium]
MLKKLTLGLFASCLFSVAAHEGDNSSATATAPITVPVKTGTNGVTFTTVPGWGKVPGQDYIGSTHGGIVIDKAGLIYVSTNGSNKLCVFEENGKFVKSMGTKLGNLHGMNINTEDGTEYIYGAAMSKVHKIALDGKVLLTIDGKEQGWKKATAVAVAPDGRIFVADGYGTSVIFVYGKDGKFITKFGVRGAGDGQFKVSHGLAMDTRGEKPYLIVCDRENKRIFKVDINDFSSKLVTTDLRRPCALSIHGDYVAVAELQGRVVILDKDFKVISKVGDNPDKSQWAKFPAAPQSWQGGIFTAPHGVSFDAKGNLYVMDWNKFGRVTKLTRDK